LIDLHTHHWRCGHAQGELEDYIQQAVKAGLNVIGLSDHSPLFAIDADEPAPGMHMPKSQYQSYLSEAQKLKVKYEGTVEVLVGLEVDYIEGTEQAYADALRHSELDYVLGSVHYFDGYHVYDPRRWQMSPDPDAVYTAYYRALQKLVQSGLYDIVAHLDAVKGLGYQATSAIAPIIDETIDMIAESGMAVEINTSGLRKVREPFPSPQIIQTLHARGVPLTFGSDSHQPFEVHYGWSVVTRVLEDVGVSELVSFRERDMHTVSLPDC
jgi:histidinol-phosphatase (PHP family)